MKLTSSADPMVTPLVSSSTLCCNARVPPASLALSRHPVATLTPYCYCRFLVAAQDSRPIQPWAHHAAMYSPNLLPFQYCLFNKTKPKEKEPTSHWWTSHLPPWLHRCHTITHSDCTGVPVTQSAIPPDSHEEREKEQKLPYTHTFAHKRHPVTNRMRDICNELRRNND